MSMALQFHQQAFVTNKSEMFETTEQWLTVVFKIEYIKWQGTKPKLLFILHCNTVALMIYYFLPQLNATHCLSVSLPCSTAM